MFAVHSRCLAVARNARALLSITIGGLLTLAGSGDLQAQCKGKDLLAQIKIDKPETFAEMQTTAKAVDNGTGIFWKIAHPDRPDAAPSYLFGTIHLSDDRVVALPTLVVETLKSSRRVALEIDDFSPRRMAAAMSAVQPEMRMQQGRRLDQIISTEDVQRLTDALGRRGVQRATVPTLKPWFLFLMSSLPACEITRATSGKEVVDVRLLKLAERSAVGTIGLETLEEQFRAMARLSDDDQSAILKAHMKTFDKIEDATETMVQLWLSEDTGMMQALGRESFRAAGTEPGVYTRFEEQLLTLRNRTMRDRAISHLTRGGIFIAVGALHLPGEHGLVNLVRDLGYTVTRVEIR